MNRVSATVQESKDWLQAQGGASGYQNFRGRNKPQVLFLWMGREA